MLIKEHRQPSKPKPRQPPDSPKGPPPTSIQSLLQPPDTKPIPTSPNQKAQASAQTLNNTKVNANSNPKQGPPPTSPFHQINNVKEQPDSRDTGWSSSGPSVHQDCDRAKKALHMTRQAAAMQRRPSVYDRPTSVVKTSLRRSAHGRRPGWAYRSPRRPTCRPTCR